MTLFTFFSFSRGLTTSHLYYYCTIKFSNSVAYLDSGYAFHFIL